MHESLEVSSRKARGDPGGNAGRSRNQEHTVTTLPGSENPRTRVQRIVAGIAVALLMLVGLAAMAYQVATSKAVSTSAGAGVVVQSLQSSADEAMPVNSGGSELHG